jgi:phosphate/sulfate permease
MNFLARVAIAVICGVIAFLLLTFFNVLTSTLDALIGALVGLVVYFGAPQIAA